MKAVILAAGMGSRLGDITKEIPKALLPIKNITLEIIDFFNILLNFVRKCIKYKIKK